MITIEAINGSPESIPAKHFGSTFDGVSFHFFESEQEKQNFYTSLPQSQPPQPQKQDISNIDVDTMTNDEAMKLANKLKPLLNSIS